MTPAEQWLADLIEKTDQTEYANVDRDCYLDLRQPEWGALERAGAIRYRYPFVEVHRVRASEVLATPGLKKTVITPNYFNRDKRLTAT